MPPPWQVMQLCVTESYEGDAGVAGRSNLAGASESCVMWHEEHALTPTVGYDPRAHRLKSGWLHFDGCC